MRRPREKGKNASEHDCCIDPIMRNYEQLDFFAPSQRYNKETRHHYYYWTLRERG